MYIQQHSLQRNNIYKSGSRGIDFKLFPKRQILDYSKLKEFTEDNFKFDENGRKLQTARKPCGKRRNYSFQAISPFPTEFSKDLYSKHVKSRACLGKG